MGIYGSVTHSYGTQNLPAMWRDQRMRKDEKNREITRVILGMASAGEAVDFEEGNPQYEFISAQFGKSVAKGMSKKNERMRIQRESEKNAAKIELGSTYLDNAFKLEEKMPGNKLTPAILKKGVDTLNSAGFDFDAESILNAHDKKAKLKEGVFNQLADKISNVSNVHDVAAIEIQLGASAKYLGKTELDQLNQGLEVKKEEMKKNEKRKYEEGKAAKDRERDKTFVDGLMEQFNAGRPLEDFAPNEQILLKKELGLKETQGTEKDRIFESWKKKPGNENKSRWDFELEFKKAPTTSIELKEDVLAKRPSAKYNKQIESQVGFMKTEAQKLAKKKIDENAKLKTDVMRGKVSSDNVAVQEMKVWVTDSKIGYPDAVLYEIDGEYVWALPDGTVVADKDGWVK